MTIQTTEPTSTNWATRSTTPELVVTFTNTLNAGRLSNFILWYLLYDIVKFPEFPSRWYRHINSMELRGWVALGQFLASGQVYGFDLVVLDSICDRLGLYKTLVHGCIIRVGNPEAMSWTTISSTFQQATAERKSELQTLELVQHNLQNLRTLASSLSPVKGTECVNWQPSIISRITEFLDSVVNPRITASRVDASEPDGAMQSPRPVPLARYGIFPDHMTESSSLDSEYAISQECDIERSFSAASLQSQVRTLRNRIHQLELAASESADVQALHQRIRCLEAENQQLVEANEQLTKKVCVASLDGSQVRSVYLQPDGFEHRHGSGGSQSGGATLFNTARGFGQGQDVEANKNAPAFDTSSGYALRATTSNDPRFETHAERSDAAGLAVPESNYPDVFGVLDGHAPPHLAFDCPHPADSGRRSSDSECLPVHHGLFRRRSTGRFLDMLLHKKGQDEEVKYPNISTNF
ncbi:hypothetical protein M011DRAFT_458152 [Sporormia fimetaria CBS 119925]|uniref:Uncharacterized protein n=1 Tax=Sporormia fimetaria CBS 119925 TaxID=1340428 RepID=A0A6A6VEW2_9PLEO|nr:hypothetical protein M011DRAFT_458152 [Sporormia fimetaria CBS 119925]